MIAGLFLVRRLVFTLGGRAIAGRGNGLLPRVRPVDGSGRRPLVVIAALRRYGLAEHDDVVRGHAGARFAAEERPVGGVSAERDSEPAAGTTDGLAGAADRRDGAKAAAAWAGGDGQPARRPSARRGRPDDCDIDVLGWTSGRDTHPDIPL